MKAPIDEIHGKARLPATLHAAAARIGSVASLESPMHQRIVHTLDWLDMDSLRDDAGPRVWKYLYRALNKEGKTVDFLLTAKRDKAAAMRFLDKAMPANDVPEKVTMDKNGANTAAIEGINAGRDVHIEGRQVKYLNNIIEQDYRAAKRVTATPTMT